MSMHVREGQRAPFDPEQWDQYDTHPGHPETIQTAVEVVGSTVTKEVVEDVVFDSYSGSGTNQLPAIMLNGKPLRVVA